MFARDQLLYSQQKGSSTLMSPFRDFQQITRLHGPLALFYGITPYALNHLLNNNEIFGDPDEEYADPRGKYWFYFTVGLWNPFNILIVRMQCVEFPIRKLHKAAWDMIKNDSYRMFYKGLLPIFTG
jgi:hypothetical protein